MSRFRPYQTDLYNAGILAWMAGHKRVMVRSATGSGKTVIAGGVARSWEQIRQHLRLPLGGASAIMAHRGELVSQIAMALARERVPHRIIGPDSLRRTCQAVQIAEMGQHWVDPGAACGVAGVDTLMNRDTSQDSWYRGIGLWMGDEAHHFREDNKWGRCVEMFGPDPLGLGFTATPGRADGKALRRDAGGCFDELVEGPSEGALIAQGYLTRYRIFAPPSNVDYSEVPVGGTGDLVLPKLRAAVHASKEFVGDVVTNYQRIAPGKLGVCFCVDVESAAEIAQAFRDKGIPAEVISAKTDPINRQRLLREFREGRIRILTNVDLFGEGFDLPAIEVVIMARKTESLPLYMQQFGRVLRPMVSADLMVRWGDMTDDERLAHLAASAKPYGIVIDHVQNVHRHGLPDSPRMWSLDGRERRSNGPSDAIPLRTCTAPHPVHGLPQLCLFTYERTRSTCPLCNAAPEVTNRSAPEFVDGDLYELSPEVLAALRGEIIDPYKAPPSWPGAPQGSINLKHQERIIAQMALRKAISLWSGWQLHLGRDDREQMKRFYFSFGLDMMSAQALGRPEATALRERIEQVLQRERVYEQT